MCGKGAMEVKVGSQKNIGLKSLREMRRQSYTKRLALFVILCAVAWMIVYFEQTGGFIKQTDRVQSQHLQDSGFTEDLSLQTVSNAKTEQIATSLKTAVPGLQELFVQKMADGGVSIVATSSLRGLPHTYLTASDDATRYLLAAYRLPGIRVDFAALYIEEDGHYIMAVGLGDQAAKTLALKTFAPDQGVQLTRELASVDRYTHALTNQAFAEYRS